MAIRKLHTVVAIVGIALAGGAAWWYQNRSAGTDPATAASPAPGGTPAAGAGRAASGGPAAAGPSAAGPGAGPVAVEVGRVTTVTLEDDAQAVGTVRARQSVLVKPEASGRIERIGFADGAAVRRGQLLFQLDDALQQAQLKQAQAQAGIARTQLQRSRELAAQNFISQSAVDQNQANLEVALAQVALAQAQVARMRILAPFDGVAGIRQVNVGDYVKDGAELVQLEDVSAVWVDFRMPERFIAQIRPGQSVDVQMDALPGRRFSGKVAALDALVDANGRSLLVRARLDNPRGELKSGMFARTRVVFGQRANALVVPEEALVPQGARQYLIKVVDGPDGKKVSQRIEARIGSRLPGQVEILEGVAAGDLVVTAGQARLMRGDGLPVRVVEIGQNGNSPATPPTPARANSATPRPA